VSPCFQRIVIVHRPPSSLDRGTKGFILDFGRGHWCNAELLLFPTEVDVS